MDTDRNSFALLPTNQKYLLPFQPPGPKPNTPSTSDMATFPPPRPEYPFHIRYGNGEDVPYPVIQTLRGLAWELATAIQPVANDLLVVDNYAAQHGRLGYEGSRRMWLGISLD